MTTEEIKKTRHLLSRYYDAVTSRKEETELRKLLNHPDLSHEFHADRDLFSRMDSIRVPDGFEERIARIADSLTASRRKSPYRRIYSLSAAAAIILIIAIAGISLSRHSSLSRELTPEETYAYTEKALGLFATTIAEGYAGIRHAETTTNKAIEETNRALEILNSKQ